MDEVGNFNFGRFSGGMSQSKAVSAYKAAAWGHLPLVKFLIARGADTSIVTNQHGNLDNLAQNHVDIVSYLEGLKREAKRVAALEALEAIKRDAANFNNASLAAIPGELHYVVQPEGRAAAVANYHAALAAFFGNGLE
jgi:hypothetical protein